MSLSHTGDSQVIAQAKATRAYITRALLSLISAALLLRLGGMVNQIVVSATFGAGAEMDAYFVAAAFPLLLVQLLSSAIEAAVIPIYSRERLHASQQDVARLFSTLLNGLLLLAPVLAGLLLLLRGPLVHFSAPGLDTENTAQALLLTPLLYLAVPLSLLIGLLECVLNAEGQFGWPAYAGLLVPLTTAILTMLGGHTYGIQMLCLGTLMGTLFQLLMVIVRVYRSRLPYQFVLDLRHPGLAPIARALWPLVLGALLSQGSPLVDQVVASLLPTGSISALNYALKLVSLFSGIIFVSSGRALLPYLARLASSGEPTYQAFKATLRLALQGMTLLVLLLSLLTALLARPLIEVLFQHGSFSASDTTSTVKMLDGFLVGLVPMALSFLLSRALNALGETLIPMRVALVCIAANAGFDALFAYFWQGMGIALATSAVYALSCVILLSALHRRIGNLHLLAAPLELHSLLRQCAHGWERFNEWLKNEQARLRQGLLAACLTLGVLALGTLATVRNAFMTLRACAGLLVVCCFVRYPYCLLLAWACLPVFLGSTLPVFNGNHLDTLLLAPLLFFQIALPWPRIVRAMPALLWLLLYLVWVLAGIRLSPLSTSAFLTLWLTMLSYVALAALTITLVTTHKRLLLVIDTLLFTAMVAAGVGLAGFLTHQGGELDPQTGLFRTTGFFTQATTLALYLSVLLPLALYRCFSLAGSRKLAGIAITLSLLLTILLTFTRSAIISVALEALIMAFALPMPRQRASTLGGLAILYISLTLVSWSGSSSLLARFFAGDAGTLNGRVYLWQALLLHFQVTQWQGYGLEASDTLLTYLRVGNLGQGVIGTAPHSLFLGTLYDHGGIGLGLLLAVFGSSGYALLRGWRRYRGERRLLCAAVLASWVGLFLQSLTSRDLWIQAVGTPFWMVAALPFVSVWSLSLPASTADAQKQAVDPPTGERVTPDIHTRLERLG
jgi:putative peptidoglycan lipid II flippase